MVLGARLAYSSLSTISSPIMKRTLLFTLALLFAVPAASAQSTIGLRAGLNTASWSNDNDATNPRLGFVGGLTARYQATSTFSLQGEVLYSQEGAVDEVLDGTYKSDYVNIPVLVRASVPLSPFADAGAFVGPTVSIPVNGTFAPSEGPDEPFDAFQKTTYGVTVGVDYYAGPVGVDLRYTTGLGDVFDADYPETDLVDAKNQVFAVTLGYRFGG
ncbi:MAG: hypothetical protein Rubg2KO_36410 [Rubricoccaceae bacterium]